MSALLLQQQQPQYASKWVTFAASAVLQVGRSSTHVCGTCRPLPLTTTTAARLCPHSTHTTPTQACSGLAYSFSVYAPTIKEALDLSQTQIAAVGSTVNLGGYLAIVSGSLYDAAKEHHKLGPRWVGGVEGGRGSRQQGALSTRTLGCLTCRCGPDAPPLTTPRHTCPAQAGGVAGVCVLLWLPGDVSHGGRPHAAQLHTAARVRRSSRCAGTVCVRLRAVSAAQLSIQARSRALLPLLQATWARGLTHARWSRACATSPPSVASSSAC